MSRSAIYHIYMRCVLVLQLPTPDLRYGHVITASSNPELLRHFCSTVIADQERRAEETSDLLDRELQRIRLEQLRVQLAWALGGAGTKLPPDTPWPGEADSPEAEAPDA
jgi:hypothetical protein